MSQLRHVVELNMAGVAFPTALHGDISSQLTKAGFRNLGAENGWSDNKEHTSNKFYQENKSHFKTVFDSGDGYELSVDFEHKAFFSTYSGD